MKQITLILIFLALSFNLLAQPTAITWQGKLLDNSGNAINQSNVAMTFAMFDAETEGNQLWPASGVVAKVVNVVNGLYSVQLGTGIADDMAFTAAMFNGNTPWLEVKVGTEKLPRTEISNVPFALISNDLSAAGWESPGEIGKTNPNTGKFTSLEAESVKITTGAADGKVLTSDASGNSTWITPQYQASGTAPGQMQYWNGTAWVNLPVGQPGQFLFFTSSNIPVWTSIGLPKVTTSIVTSISSTSATCGGFVNNFGENITERGVCWSTSPGATTALNSKTSDGTGTGDFTSSITGLEFSTTYYVRAYATTSTGTYYGDEIVFMTSMIAIGDYYGGGVVFYILQSGDVGYNPDLTHGLISALSDQSIAANWGCQGTFISGTSHDIGTGAANTAAIISLCSDLSCAARICSDLSLNGYDDWYLPSLSEAYQLCANKAVIPGISGAYWTSSQYSTNNGWGRNLNNCSSYYQSKNNQYKVRAIRSF